MVGATPKARSELLRRMADVMDEHAEELAQLESVNVGKPLMASRDEMPFSADNIRFFAAPRACWRASLPASTSRGTRR